MSTWSGFGCEQKSDKRVRNHAYDAEYREKNREILRQKAKAYASSHKESIAIYQKGYKQRPESKSNRAAWMQKQKELVSPSYLSHVFRARVTKILKYRSSKDIGFSRTKELAFIDFEQLKIKLESEFCEGWSWSNWGKVWHIDHIWPCRIFDLTNPVHIKACFSIENMRALSAKENLYKFDSIPVDIPFPFMIQPVLRYGELLSYGQTFQQKVCINES